MYRFLLQTYITRFRNNIQIYEYMMKRNTTFKDVFSSKDCFVSLCQNKRRQKTASKLCGSFSWSDNQPWLNPIVGCSPAIQMETKWHVTNNVLLRIHWSIVVTSLSHTVASNSKALFLCTLILVIKETGIPMLSNVKTFPSVDLTDSRSPIFRYLRSTVGPLWRRC